MRWDLPLLQKRRGWLSIHLSMLVVRITTTWEAMNITTTTLQENDHIPKSATAANGRAEGLAMLLETKTLLASPNHVIHLQHSYLSIQSSYTNSRSWLSLPWEIYMTNLSRLLTLCQLRRHPKKCQRHHFWTRVLPSEAKGRGNAGSVGVFVYKPGQWRNSYCSIS